METLPCTSATINFAITEVISYPRLTPGIDTKQRLKY